MHGVTTGDFVMSSRLGFGVSNAEFSRRHRQPEDSSVEDVIDFSDLTRIALEFSRSARHKTGSPDELENAWEDAESTPLEDIREMRRKIEADVGFRVLPVNSFQAFPV